jgi:TetR/AcrR family transcriptional regulator, mexCD-oprJ operon repressor
MPDTTPPGTRSPGTRSTGTRSTGTGRERRADARRNIAAILDATVECLSRDPQASIADIAAAAGVGRITLYGHFASRAELIDAAFEHALHQADQVLDAVDLSGDPRDALARLIASSWQIMDRFRGALANAERELPPERIRGHHGEPMSRVGALISRGQHAGVFRTDLPLEWLVTLFYTVMHGAAAEITAGRLASDDAPRVITATLLAAYTPPPAR